MALVAESLAAPPRSRGLGVRGIFECPPDGVAPVYQPRAQDASAPEAQRAAQHFVEAEAQLNARSVEEAMDNAETALGIFRKAKDMTGVADALRIMVGVHRLQEDVSKGLALATEELEKFSSAGNPRGEGMMHLSIAELHLHRERYKDAKAPAEQAQSLLLSSGDRAMEGLAWLALSVVAHGRRDAGEAVAAARAAREAFAAVGSGVGEAQALDRLAHAHFLGDSISDGLRAVEESMALFQALGDGRGHAAQLTAAARAHLVLERPEVALPLARQANEIYRDVKEWRGAGSALAMEVEALFEKGDVQRAVTTAQNGQTLVCRQQPRDARAQLTVWHLLAETILKMYLQADFEVLEKEATTAAENALELAREINDRRMEAAALQQLGRLHLNGRRLVEAGEVLEEALNICEQSREAFGYGEGAVLLTLVDVHLQQREEDEALRKAEEAKALFQEMGDNRALFEAFLTSAHAYEQLGKFPLALEAAKEARELKKEAGDVSGEVTALLRTAHLHAKKGAEADALEGAKAAWEAAQTYAGGKNPRERMEAMQMVGELLLRKDNFDEVLSIMSEAKAFFRRVKDRLGEAYASTCYAQAQFRIFMRDSSGATEGKKQDEDRKDKDKELFRAARKAGAEAAKLARLTGDLRCLAAALDVHSNVLCTEKETLVEAAQACAELADLSRKVGDVISEAYAALRCAKVRDALGRAKEARVAASRAHLLFQELGNDEGSKAAEVILDRHHALKIAPETAASAILNSLGLVAEDMAMTDAALRDSGIDSLSFFGWPRTTKPADLVPDLSSI